MKIIVETSARHVHLKQEDLETLFGKGESLTHKKDLSQPGQFASEERVTIKGPKNEIKNVLILGPCRDASQVEISMSDARTLGVNGIVKESGDLSGTCGITISGPCGEIELQEGVIVAKRHIHATTKEASELGVKDKDIVSVKIDTPDRSLIFGDVVVRVNDNFALAMHIDTDEANAAMASGLVYGEIVK